MSVKTDVEVLRSIVTDNTKKAIDENQKQKESSMNQVLTVNKSNESKNCHVYTTTDGKNIIYLQKSLFNGEVPDVLEVTVKKH